MNGIVLWYKCDKKTGLVWCEDQGPLACITPASELGEDHGALQAGDQIVFETHEENGMRQLRKLISLRRSAGSLDIQALLSAEAARLKSAEEAERTQSQPRSQPQAQNAGHLRVVA